MSRRREPRPQRREVREQPVHVRRPPHRERRDDVREKVVREQVVVAVRLEGQGELAGGGGGHGWVLVGVAIRGDLEAAIVLVVPLLRLDVVPLRILGRRRPSVHGVAGAPLCRLDRKDATWPEARQQAERPAVRATQTHVSTRDRLAKRRCPGGVRHDIDERAVPELAVAAQTAPRIAGTLRESGRRMAPGSRIRASPTEWQAQVRRRVS